MIQEVIRVAKENKHEKVHDEVENVEEKAVIDENEVIDDVKNEDVQTLSNEDLQAKLSEEQNKVKELQAQVVELENKYYMAYADAKNIAKRAQVDAENMVNSKVSSMVQHILPALDNFERAVSIDTDDQKTLNFLKGFKMVYDQLYNALEKEGIKRIDSIGKEFNPNLHQSVGTVQDEKYIPNTVVEEVQKGYTFRGKVIRHAMVKINE